MRPSLPLPTFALLLVLSCTQGEEDACGERQVYDDGACRPKPSAAAGGTGSGGEAALGGAAGAPAEPSRFGVSCEVSEDCTGDTDYCAVSPAAPAYCTASGCDGDDGVCPAGWSCFDVSRFVPGEPWICSQP